MRTAGGRMGHTGRGKCRENPLFYETKRTSRLLGKRHTQKKAAAYHACAQKCASAPKLRDMFDVFCTQFAMISHKTRFRRSVRNRCFGKNAPCFAGIWKTRKITPKWRAEKTTVFCDGFLCIKNLLSTVPSSLSSRKVVHFCTFPIF